MPKISKMIADVLKTYNLGEEAVWDCHGTWVMYHRYCEQIAAQAGVKFDLPTFLETSSKDKTVAVLVTGSLGDRYEWSVGEASPANCKNSYPYAMAEKRAKDRVILKLIGLSGFVYSEEEADAFDPVDDLYDRLSTKAQEGDEYGLRESWGEADRPTLLKAWKRFNSKEKSGIRDLLLAAPDDDLLSVLKALETNDPAKVKKAWRSMDTKRQESVWMQLNMKISETLRIYLNSEEKAA